MFDIGSGAARLDTYTAAHWTDVRAILEDVIRDAGFGPNLVSEAVDVGTIHKRIIQNLYDNPVVVCDVSGKNPNVMFELGLRLAFDKPTIVIKDDVTDYSFDTFPIEHLSYVRDLRFPSITTFKETLKSKIEGTHAAANSDPKYSTFLKHFGDFTVPRLETKEVPEAQFILDELRSITARLARIERDSGLRQDRVAPLARATQEMPGAPVIGYSLENASVETVKKAAKFATNLLGADFVNQDDDRLFVVFRPGTNRLAFERTLANILAKGGKEA